MSIINVFKTDVDNPSVAKMVLDEIRQILPNSNPSFDLEDCDRVLRIEHSNTNINYRIIADILARHGHQLEILP